MTFLFLPQQQITVFINTTTIRSSRHSGKSIIYATVKMPFSSLESRCDMIITRRFYSVISILFYSSGSPRSKIRNYITSKKRLEMIISHHGRKTVIFHLGRKLLNLTPYITVFSLESLVFLRKNVEQGLTKSWATN